MTSPDSQKWQNKNRELFGGDPELISAAHPAVVHGKYSTYSNWGCRCVPCTEDWGRYCREAQQRRAARPIPEHVHGTQNGYGNYGCRCRPCTDIWTAASLDRRHRAARRREKNK